MEYGFQKELYPSQKQFISDAVKAVAKGEFVVMSSPTGTGKTLSLLCTAINFLTSTENELVALLGNKKKTRIYYCSRTHSQLEQVIEELKKNEKKYFSIILGSRKKYCINSEVSRGSSVEIINNRCKEAIKSDQCKYFGSHYYLQESLNIEDLCKLGKELEFCPYYYARDQSQSCEIVLLPYNFLFSKRIRDGLDIELDDKIIILDEAHNIYNTVIEQNSVEIRWDDIRVISQLKNIPSEVSEIVGRLYDFRKSVTKESVYEVVSFLVATGLSKYNMLDIDDIIHSKRIAQKNDLPVIFALSKFLFHLTYSDSSGRVFSDKYKLRFTPLSPDMYFRDLKSAKSVVFAGGTMEPIDNLKSIFPSLKYFSYPPVADDFLAMIIAESVHKSTIRLSYTEREKQLDSVLDTLIAITNTVKQGGVLIFVPSSHFLSEIAKNRKTKFFRRKVSFENNIKEFGCNPHIFFTVLGGRLSEGINFSDDMCRLIVVVGVPYPTLSLETTEREKHSPGFQVREAMQRVNQALGRAIRHKTDYAAMVLLDSRYLSLRKHITPWIDKKMSLEKPPSAIKKIYDFLQQHSTK